jgi:hypothetical protein
MPSFEGKDWSELIKHFQLPETGHEIRDAEVLCAFLECASEETVQDVREFCLDLANQLDGDCCKLEGCGDVWRAVASVPDNHCFLKMFKPLLLQAWV